MAKRNESLRAEMRRLIEEHEASGKSLAKFARERGVSPWTLYNWRRQLRTEAADEPIRFVEVKIAGARPAPPIAVELAGGLRVCAVPEYSFRFAISSSSVPPSFHAGEVPAGERRCTRKAMPRREPSALEPILPML